MPKIGDKVDLSPAKGRLYRTMVEDIGEDGALFVSPPFYRGVPLPMHLEDEYELYFYPTNGRYRLTVRVFDIVTTGTLRLIALIPQSEPEKQQRRASYRLKAAVKTDVGHYAPDTKSLETVETVFTDDLSESGIRLQTAQGYKKGETVALRFHLNLLDGQEKPIEIMGRICRTGIDANKNKHYVGVEFIDISRRDRTRIARFVLREQQKRIRKERWLEGE